MLSLLSSLVLLTLLTMNWHLFLNSLMFLSFLWMIKPMHHFFIFNLSKNLATDSISYIMILLTLWIMILILYASQNILQNNQHTFLFNLNLLTLLFFLLLTFSVWDLLFFYVCFESSLIPTLILIIGWGYQPERIQAGVYMLFYTLTASLPLLMSLITLYQSSGTLMFNLISPMSNLNFISVLWYFASIFAFLVKMPMFLLHLWLPKAHVEAPLAGSMILAGVLLKLGGYGLIRIMPLLMKINKNISSLWISIGLLGGSMVSIMCLRQTDMKSLIAYSSVAHMGLVLCGLMLFNTWSLSGSITLMVGHGLCSSGLFFLANIIYKRTASRSLMINKGLMMIMPSMSLWWFLLSVGNMAAPPTINLLGEINLLTTIMSWNPLSLWGLASLSFLSASYCIFLYSSSQHGVFFNSVFSSYSGKTQEFFTLFLHWTPLNILILKSTFFLS